MIVIPIGIQCTNGRFLQLNDKRKLAFPFDYMFTTPKFVLEMLELLLIKKRHLGSKREGDQPFLESPSA